MARPPGIPQSEETREAIGTAIREHWDDLRQSQVTLIRTWIETGHLVDAIASRVEEIDKRLSEGKRPTSEQKHFLNTLMRFARSSD